MPRGWVSMKVTTTATSPASSRLPESRASLQLLGRPVGRQSRHDRAGRDRADPDAVLEHLPANGLGKAVDRPLGGRVNRLPGIGTCAASELVTMMSPLRRAIMCGSTTCTVFITTLTLRCNIRSIAAVSLSTNRHQHTNPHQRAGCRFGQSDPARASPGSRRPSGRAHRCANGITASRSTITPRAPAVRMASQLARPMPDAAPVPTATLPSNTPAMRIGFGWAPRT